MGLTKEVQITLYTNMVRARRLDQYLVEAFSKQQISGPYFHSQQGQEAVGAGFCSFLRQDDYLFYTHRGHGLCELIAKGLPVKLLIAEHDCRKTGSCQGIGYMNTCYPSHGIFGLCGTLGSDGPLAAGTALAARFNGRGQITALLSTDGAMGEGAMHEAMLMMANWKLPVVWVIANNGYQMWTPSSVAFPKKDVSDLAFGFGIPAQVVDGQDVLAVHTAVDKAVRGARKGKGPSIIECKTKRARSHMEGIPPYNMDRRFTSDEIAACRQDDPIERFEKLLINTGVLTQEKMDAIASDAHREIMEAEAFARQSPYPEPDILETALYAD